MKNKVIYKYRLAPEIELPKGATILGCYAKSDGEFLYASVPTNTDEIENRKFAVLSTGEQFDEDKMKAYIGSFILDDYYIYHVYEMK